MSGEMLCLSVYFGERERAGKRLLAEELMRCCQRRGAACAALMRGAGGFGMKHAVRTDQLLSLSEDLPMVLSVLDGSERVRALAAEIEDISPHGLITLEHARGPLVEPAEASAAARLTIHVGRADRWQGRPAHIALVQAMHAGGLIEASAAMAVDGTWDGFRARGAMFAGNGRVPVIVSAVGESERVAHVAHLLSGAIEGSVTALQRVSVMRRGQADEASPPQHGWQRLTLSSREGMTSDGRPLHSALLSALRAEGAAGSSALRAVWGFRSPGEPSGERVLSLRRSVPVQSVVVDRAGACRRWLELIDRIAPQECVITSQPLLAARSGAPGARSGTLGP